jgi:hypothetical protein
MALKIANWFFIPAFLLSVVVQYNDPDPIRWMAIYGAAFVMCCLSLAGRLRWWMPALAGAVALVWAFSILPHLVGHAIDWGQVFGHMKMANGVVEETREMGGLLIVAVWMAVLTLAKSTKAPVHQV